MLDSINSGAVSTLPLPQLERFAVVLCHKNAFAFFGNNQFPQICETIRLHLLRAHVDALQAHITSLNRKNTTLQILVILLATASLLSSALQIYLQLR